MLRNSTSFEQLTKWAMMFTQFAIEFKPWPTVKGQAIVDFIVECRQETQALIAMPTRGAMMGNVN